MAGTALAAAGAASGDRSRPLRTSAERRHGDRDGEPDGRPRHGVAGVPDRRAATSAPVTPVPRAVPSESVSDSADEARPCSPAGASRRTISASGE